jgi:hypothetical protein
MINRHGGDIGHNTEMRAAFDTIKQNQDLLEDFAETRPRIDVSYQRDPYTAPDQYNKPFEESGMYAMEPSVGGIASTFADSALDTGRRALSEIGMGWSPQTSVSTKAGRRELGMTWAKRAGATVGAALGYRAADTGLDVVLPDEAPGGEGITQELSDIAANSRMAASQVYDALGITGAAQYMEGLMPKSTSMLPGAAAGAYATNSMLGAVAGEVACLG